MGHTGGLKTPAPGADNAKPVFLIPVGLPCLKRGRLSQKRLVLALMTTRCPNKDLRTELIRKSTTLQEAFENAQQNYSTKRTSDIQEITAAAKNCYTQQTKPQAGELLDPSHPMSPMWKIGPHKEQVQGQAAQPHPTKWTRDHSKKHKRNGQVQLRTHTKSRIFILIQIRKNSGRFFPALWLVK